MLKYTFNVPLCNLILYSVVPSTCALLYGDHIHYNIILVVVGDLNIRSLHLNLPKDHIPKQLVMRVNQCHLRRLMKRLVEEGNPLQVKFVMRKGNKFFFNDNNWVFVCHCVFLISNYTIDFCLCVMLSLQS